MLFEGNFGKMYFCIIVCGLATLANLLQCLAINDVTIPPQPIDEAMDCIDSVRVAEQVRGINYKF